MMTLEALRAALDAQPRPVCAALTPFSLEDVRGEDVFLLFEPQPAFRNHFGNIQGGFAVAMLDTLLSIAVYAAREVWAPTLEIKTSFLAPIPIGPCRAEGRVVKSGRSVAFVEGRLLTADGQPGVVASATVLMPAKA